MVTMIGQLPNGDPRIFEFPCWFPAAPSIRPENPEQDFDQKRLFDMGRPRKKFLPCVSLRGRERESPVTPGKTGKDA
jgi:hypothetical protein